MSKNSLIGVLGLGNWGTALGQHLANQGHKVIAWTINEDVVQSINENRLNPNFLSDIKLSANLQATSDLEDLESVDYLLSVLPAHALSSVFPTVKVHSKAIFINATKGLDPKTLKSPVELAKELIPNLKAYSAISGPSFAKDVAAGLPAGLVMAADSMNLSRELAELFNADNLKIYHSDDIVGVELGGIVKNVIAIAAGAADGLQLGDSARAGIITRGLAEIVDLAEAMGAKRDTMFGLAGLGDLVLTATCDNSRNRRVGLSLGAGESLENSLKFAGSTAEGVLASKVVSELAAKNNLEMPITKLVSQLVEGKVSAKEMLKKLMSRPARAEFS